MKITLMAMCLATKYESAEEVQIRLDKSAEEAMRKTIEFQRKIKGEV